MKQNKNSSVIRFFSFNLSIVVLLLSLSVPSLADSFDYSAWDNQPIPLYVTGTAVDLFNASYKIARSNAITYGSVSRLSTSRDIYCFVYQSYIVHCSTFNDAEFSIVEYNSNNSSAVQGAWISLSNASSQVVNGTTYYYATRGPLGLNDIYCPSFTTVTEGLEAVDYLINNPSAPSEPHALSLTVPAGNAVYIDVTGISTVRASLSMSSEVAHPLNWTSNQYYGFTSSYPSSISGNPSGSTPIPWTGYGDKTLFNRYKTFSWSLTSVGSSDFLFIVNPYASLDEYDQSFNPTIYVNVAEANGYKYYQLTGGISSDGTIGQQSDGTTATGTYDDTSETWVTTNDQTGLPWTPSEGGGNIITQNSINSWLQTISTQIGNFFSGAIGAVTTLVSAGSDFIHSLSGLYAWLPPPVYSILVSALILVITIGVIKVFI